MGFGSGRTREGSLLVRHSRRMDHEPFTSEERDHLPEPVLGPTSAPAAPHALEWGRLIPPCGPERMAWDARWNFKRFRNAHPMPIAPWPIGLLTSSDRALDLEVRWSPDGEAAGTLVAPRHFLEMPRRR